MSLVLSPRSAPATASCFPRHALPRRHSVRHRSAPAGHHPRLARAMLCHHDGGTLWIKLTAGAQQVRILRVLMPHEGFFMFYIITITLRCALAQPSHLPLLPAPMTPALHCSPRLWHMILTACDCLILSTTQAARRWWSRSRSRVWKVENSRVAFIPIFAIWSHGWTWMWRRVCKGILRFRGRECQKFLRVAPRAGAA